jgi:acetyl-CoA carboxylase biotin carboxyl carrier protein
MPLSDEDVREILRIIDESDLDELSIKTDGFSLHVVKGAGGNTASPPPVRTRAGEEAPSPPATRSSTSDDLLTIDSPMLGTFYRAEGPGKAPFVDVGGTVEPDTIVCIIEVMKMMNSIPARVAGTVVEVCPDNAELVEYGEPLFKVRP